MNKLTVHIHTISPIFTNLRCFRKGIPLFRRLILKSKKINISWLMPPINIKLAVSNNIRFKLKIVKIMLIMKETIKSEK